MERIIGIIGMVLLLTACGSDEAGTETGPSETEQQTSEQQTAGPTQEELNQQLKDEAVEIDFVEANGGGVEVGTKVKATGEVSFLNEFTFTLTTDEGEGSGMYEIQYVNTTDTVFEDGDTVTIYGAFTGKLESTGMPSISTSLIEPTE